MAKKRMMCESWKNWWAFVFCLFFYVLKFQMYTFYICLTFVEHLTLEEVMIKTVIYHV